MEMEATRILINSSPRSGHAWLQFILAHYKGNDSNIDLGDIGGDQFIVRANTPIMLLAPVPPNWLLSPPPFEFWIRMIPISNRLTKKINTEIIIVIIICY